MLLECATIILVIIVAFFMLIGKGMGYAIGVLPLLILPATHIMGKTFHLGVAKMLSVTPTTAYMLLDILALMVACLATGVIATQIRQKSTRMSYLIICGLFSACLCCVLIVNMLVL